MNTQALECMKTRRSCRRYLDKQITKEALSAILEAGTYAPTGMGKQSPVIVAVQDAETIRQLSRLNAAVMNGTGDPFYGAPTVLVVFADSERPTWLEDGALVMGNLLNAAHAAGVASCYIYRAREVFRTEEGRALMKKWGLSENYIGVGNCILGYASEGGEKEAAPRKSDYIIMA